MREVCRRGADGIEVWMKGWRELGRWGGDWGGSGCGRGNMKRGCVLGEAKGLDGCREERPRWVDTRHGR